MKNCDPVGMEYAVYVAVPAGEDSDRIARGVLEAAPSGAGLLAARKRDPSESSDVELCFRIRGVSHPDEALSEALQLYALGRGAARLKPDDRARASLAE
jgi:hypothetical protein